MRKALLIVALAVGMTAAAQKEKQELLHMTGTVTEKTITDEGHEVYLLKIDKNMNQFIKDNIDTWIIMNDGTVTHSWEIMKSGAIMMSCFVGSNGYVIAHIPKSNMAIIRVIYYEN